MANSFLPFANPAMPAPGAFPQFAEGIPGFSRPRQENMQNRQIEYVSQYTGLYEKAHFGRKLGEGAFGAAYKLNDAQGNPLPLVCKKLTIRDMFGFGNKNIINHMTLNEIDALWKMNLLEGYHREGDDYYIIMKHVDGTNNATMPSNFLANMKDVLLNGRDMSFQSDDVNQAYFNALRDCHRRNITHFDAHIGNILRNQNTGKATMIDFGLSDNASFVNIYADVTKFCVINGISPSFTKLSKMFINDFVQNTKKHPFLFAGNLLWWGTIGIGLMFGMPALGLTSAFFSTYLTAKLVHQLFIEALSIARLSPDRVGMMMAPLMPKHKLFQVASALLAIASLVIFKPVYLVAAIIPIKFSRYLVETGGTCVNAILNLFRSKPVLEAAKGAANMGAGPCMQAAMLYYPAKEALCLANAAVKHVEPEAVTKARGDIYFQYNPALYLRAGVAKAAKALNMEAQARKYILG